MPLAGSPVWTGATTPPNDGFFTTSANFVGAFGSVNWAETWSTLGFTTVSVNEVYDYSIPVLYELKQNYPNPFNPNTNISYSIPQSGNVKLTVYNMLGQEVANLVNGYKETGSYTITWNAQNMASGIYVYRLEAGNQVISKKMTLLK